MSWEGQATGVTFQFFQWILSYKRQFETDNLMFCFEGGSLYRNNIYPEYKASRRKDESKLTEEEKNAYSELHGQIVELRRRWLLKMGFKNVITYRGYESDDVMAAFAKNTKDEVILVTSDEDLYQCLEGDRVVMYSPHKKTFYTEKALMEEYGVKPKQWALVKALAGCAGDNVEGLKGIGERTACKFLRGELNPTSKVYEIIKSEKAKEVVRRNRPLVELPYKNCPIPDPKEDEVTVEKWDEVCDQLGMISLLGFGTGRARRSVSVPATAPKKKGEKLKKYNAEQFELGFDV